MINKFNSNSNNESGTGIVAMFIICFAVVVVVALGFIFAGRLMLENDALWEAGKLSMAMVVAMA